MIKTLQRKFIRSAMLAVTLVMALFLAAINILNFTSVNQDTNRVMQLIQLENSGVEPGDDEEPPGETVPFDAASSDVGSETSSVSEVPEEPPAKPDSSAAEEQLLNENYFFVRFTSGGRIIYTDLSHVAALGQSAAENIAESAYEDGKSSGRVDGYLYEREEDEMTGGAVYAFLDTSEESRSVFRTMVLTLIVGACAWGLVLLLVIFMSRKAIRPAAESIERQKEFVTDAGHEIKTPLAIIRANADVLELHMGKSKWIDNIRSQTDRLASLTQNLLTLSKMEEGNEERLPAADFDAAQVLRETMETYRESAEIRHLKFVLPDPDLRVPFHFQKDVYVQLVNILAENAVKYAREGGFIEASVHRSGHHLTLVLRNDVAEPLTGDPERLFDRFYRADKARTQKTGGSGIGLSVAKALVGGTGGTISAKYDSDHLITFTAGLKEL